MAAVAVSYKDPHFNHYAYFGYQNNANVSQFKKLIQFWRFRAILFNYHEHHDTCCESLT